MSLADTGVAETVVVLGLGEASGSLTSCRLGFTMQALICKPPSPNEDCGRDTSMSNLRQWLTIQGFKHLQYSPEALLSFHRSI